MNWPFFMVTLSASSCTSNIYWPDLGKTYKKHGLNTMNELDDS